MKKLHILNGQGTADNFELEGDQIVWNEALACGPTHYQVASQEYHQVRQQFYRQYTNLPLREPFQFSLEEYERIVTREMNKLSSVGDYDEITLWFEFDWFCQINMMAVLSWFWQAKVGLDHLYLVCIDDHPAVEDFRGLGQLSSMHFGPLFENRQKLTSEDIAFADKVWAAYCGQDMKALEAFIKNNTPDAFPFLTSAFQHFQQLFPNTENGLNVIEYQMLDILRTQSPDNRHQWVGKMLRQSNPHLGFGDMQYYDSMQRMNDLWEENGQVKLTSLGEQVLNEQQNFLDIQPNEFALGGVNNVDYRWEANTQTLINKK
ncbi:hypothetical protein BKI52_10205 [marine bacterium AO1-C]|nr:hypothetical protein BKI52_10205 [marine bacterium AO1-C]